MGLNNWFAHVVVYHPYIVLAVVAVFSGSCLVIPFTLRPFPDFSDPQMGFETRGTTIAKRVTTWKNLIEATRPSGELTVNPKEYFKSKKFDSMFKEKRQQKRKTKKSQKSPPIYVNKLTYNKSRETSKGINWTRLRQELEETIMARNQHRLEEPRKAGFFCGGPDEGYSQLVVKSLNGSDLFNLHSLLVMCRIERELMQANHYKELCIQTTEKPKKCCKPWSLANYIALLHKRKSCLALTEEDVNATKSLLKNCAKYFHTLKITTDCTERGFCKAPLQCIRHDAVYNIMNFLTDISFLSPNDSSDDVLKETMIFLPLACSTAMLPYYHEIEKIDLEYEGISVVAMEFGIKNALFDECLLRDAWLMTFGGLFVLFCMWLYTGSLFLTFMTIIAIIFSLGISYFLYMLVFELNFFPFMNLLATVVAVGIGADDAFIFCKIWNATKQEKKSAMVKLMGDTFHHAFFSIFVLSITTAVAFLASYISNITAICCFSVFAGIAVLTNFLLMVSWFPACVVIWERSCQTNAEFIKKFLMTYLHRPCFIQSLTVSSAWLKCKCSYLGRLWNAKEQLLLNSIVSYRIIWLTLLSLVALASCVIVLYYPKFELPSSPEFQLFDRVHPFEQYDLVYKNRFWFKREQRSESESTSVMKLPLRFVWGVLPADTGSHLDPQSRGSLQFDPTFDMSDPESQAWLLKFCRRLRQQPFYQPTLGPLLPNCFIESFMASMQRRRCLDSFDNINRTPCCESEKFPYNRSVFNTCIVNAIADLYETPSEYFIPGVAGPKFSKDDQNPTIKVVAVEYDSNYTYSMSYNYMHQFYMEVENWMQEELKTAPATMKNGWFISELEFYDLQRELSECTIGAISISMVLALIVLLLSTFNIITSLFAIITISCSIFVTMAVLVLLGWKLNVLESVAMSTAIGLTVDFSLHYTVTYSMCPTAVTKDRKSATRYALSSMAGPAAMAALTTGAAGAFMMPSLVLAYIQIGIFLVTVMAVSWFYATFHLGSLLAVAGPQNHFGQFNYSRILCFFVRRCFRTSSTINVKEYERERTTQPTVSSISDTHELDSLTSKSSVHPMPKILQRSFSNSRTNQAKYIFTDQSPSATSAITIITTEDN